MEGTQKANEDEESASRALIERLLAEEGESYDYYEAKGPERNGDSDIKSPPKRRRRKGSDNEDDRDWGPARKNKRKSEVTARSGQPAPIPPGLDMALAEDGRTNYSSARLRRKNTKKQQAVNYADLLDDANPYQLVKCEHFLGGAPASGLADAQPFTVSVHPIALAMMDLHSHLAHTEVIGFLAGHFYSDRNHIEITSAFPCRSIENDEGSQSEASKKKKKKAAADEERDRHTNVEMDPTSEFEVRQTINDRGLTAVGWYHSHPSFAPDPSVVDLENQTNYQRLFGKEEPSAAVYSEAQRIEPFIGAIVSPYDKRLPTSISAINCFFVSNHGHEIGSPKHIAYEVARQATTNDVALVESTELERMLETIRTYADRSDRVNFEKPWRTKEGPGESRLEKLLKSIRYRLSPPKSDVEQLGEATLMTVFQKVEETIRSWSTE